jgi:hypothetical protein
MQRLGVSCTVRPIYGSLGAKGLIGDMIRLFLSHPQASHKKTYEQNTTTLRRIFFSCWSASGIAL